MDRRRRTAPRRGRRTPRRGRPAGPLPRGAGARGADRVRAGGAGRVVRLADLRVRGQGGGRPGSLGGAVRARHHRRRAVRRAAGGGRPPQRGRAGRRGPDLGVRAHHRGRGAGAVADGLATADAALPDPLHDPGRRPGADRGGGRRRLLGEDPRPVRRGPLRAHAPRRQLPHPVRDHGPRRGRGPGRGPRVPAAEFGALHGGTALGAPGRRRPARCGGQGGRRTHPGGGPPGGHRPAPPAPGDRGPPRRRHGRRGTRPHPGGRPAGPPPVQGPGVRLGPGGRAGRVRHQRPLRGPDPGDPAAGGAAHRRPARGPGRAARVTGPAPEAERPGAVCSGAPGGQAGRSHTVAEGGRVRRTEAGWPWAARGSAFSGPGLVTPLPP
ncbi:hypothetical protein SGPA1_11676 [Streptomyces misionensis JCM 4497]